MNCFGHPKYDIITYPLHPCLGAGQWKWWGDVWGSWWEMVGYFLYKFQDNDKGQYENNWCQTLPSCGQNGNTSVSTECYIMNAIGNKGWHININQRDSISNILFRCNIKDVLYSGQSAPEKTTVSFMATQASVPRSPLFFAGRKWSQRNKTKTRRKRKRKRNGLNKKRKNRKTVNEKITKPGRNSRWFCGTDECLHPLS